MNRLLAVAAHDDEAARTFVEVMGMLAPPQSILRPAIVRRVLRRGATAAHARRRGSRPCTQSAQRAAEPLAEAA